MIESNSRDINYWVEEKTVRKNSHSIDKREASQYSINVGVEASFMGIGGSIDTSNASQKYLAKYFKNYLSHSRHTK